MNKKERGSNSTAFLNKLWKLVDDPVTNDLIKWSSDGASFIITDQTRFSQELVPKYFKHNNLASFIRQLNLYGFRKVTSIESGGLFIDKGEMEFSHPKFIKGQPQLFENIKRKPQGNRAVASTEGPQNLSDILTEVQMLKMNQDVMSSKMNEMKKENDVLWREYSNVRQKLSKQQNVIEKLVRFLMSIVKAPGQHIGGKWKFNHRALEGGQNSAANNIGSQNKSLKYESASLLPLTGPVIHEVTHFDEDIQAKSNDNSLTNSSDGNFNFDKSNTQSHGFHFESKSNTSFPKAEVPESIVLVEDFAEGSDSVIRDSDHPDMHQSYLENNYINNNPVTINAPAELDPIHLITSTNKSVSNLYPSSRVITVQSPEGTILHADDSPPLSPELLQAVDPSEINPNIVVNIPNKNMQMTFKRPTAPTSDSSSSSRGKNRFARAESNSLKDFAFDLFKSKPSHGKQLTDSAPSNTYDYSDYFNWNNTDPVDVVPPDTSRASNVASSKGKSWSKNGKIEQTPNSRTRHGKLISEGNLPSVSSNDIQNLIPSSNRSTSSGYDVAVPEKPFITDEFINVIDEQELSINSLRDILSTGNVNINVDLPTLYSFLGNDDDQLASTSEKINTEQDVLGNEVSLYNPSLYDFNVDGSENFNFSSLVDDDDDDDEDCSPTKRAKFDSFNLKRNDDIEEGFTTPQPHQLPFDFKSN